MIDETVLQENWKKLFDTEQDIYIYGAKKTALKIWNLAKQIKKQEKIRGFLVTSRADNPDFLEGLPVLEASALEKKDCAVFVPHLGIYKEEILSHLKQLGYQNVFPVGQFIFLLKEHDQIIDEYVQLAKMQEHEIIKKKTVEEQTRDVLFRKQIREILQEGNPDFGKLDFYQSLEQIGIYGTRPTLYRINRYGLNSLLKTYMKVLDIGCNCGFFDLQLSAQVNEIVGIEYDKTLWEIAKKTQEYLKVKNCCFKKIDFKEWYKNNINQYDFILSLAIHSWLNISSSEYVEMLDKILRDGGYICFESHEYDSDLMFEECSMLWKKKYETVNQGDIRDNVYAKRKFIIFQKSGN